MAAREERALKVLVVGSGPIGRRHAGNAELLGHEAAFARRGDLDGSAAWEPDAVVVANPPSEHLATAAWAVERGLPVLVEKPLATTVDGVDELLSAGVHVAVGHNLRFHPALGAIADAVAAGRIGRLLLVRAEVGSHLPGWHPESDYRGSSASRSALGGGALPTLVHELDLVLWIAGDARLVAGATAKVSQLDVDADDVAELVLRHESGALSSVHMDFLDRTYNRRSRWVGEDGTIEWSWGGPVRLAETVLWDEPGFDLNETYVEELRSFLAGEAAPGEPLRDARRALELIAEVRRV